MPAGINATAHVKRRFGGEGAKTRRHDAVHQRPRCAPADRLVSWPLGEGPAGPQRLWSLVQCHEVENDPSGSAPHNSTKVT